MLSSLEASRKCGKRKPSVLSILSILPCKCLAIFCVPFLCVCSWAPFSWSVVRTTQYMKAFPVTCCPATISVRTLASLLRSSRTCLWWWNCHSSKYSWSLQGSWQWYCKSHLDSAQCSWGVHMCSHWFVVRKDPCFHCPKKQLQSSIGLAKQHWPSCQRSRPARTTCGSVPYKPEENRNHCKALTIGLHLLDSLDHFCFHVQTLQLTRFTSKQTALIHYIRIMYTCLYTFIYILSTSSSCTTGGRLDLDWHRMLWALLFWFQQLLRVSSLHEEAAVAASLWDLLR